MKKNRRLMIVFHDMGLGGIQKKIIDIAKHHQENFPDTKIVLCLRERKGIFLNDIPKNIEVIAPNFHTRRFNTIWFTFWLTMKIHVLRPTQVVSFMDLGSIPTIIALKLLPWVKPRLTIGEDILTSKYIYTETYPYLRKLLIKWLYPFADTILVQTPVQKKDLEVLIGKKAINHKIVASPNWLPLDFPPKKTVLFKNRSVDILFVGRLDDQKNLPLFLEIIYQVKKLRPSICAFIVGDGTKKNSIKKLIKKLNLQKNVYIKKPTLNTFAYYSQAKMFLLTSNYEGFPLTLMEAISSGCSPVVRNIPEISQFFVENKSQIIFDDTKGAVKIILNILRNNKSDYLKQYRKKVLINQKKHISTYIKYFTRP